MKRVYYFSEKQHEVVKSFSLSDPYFNPNNKIDGKLFTECIQFKDDEVHPPQNLWSDSFVVAVKFES